MEVIIQPDEKAAAEWAAQQIASAIEAKPNLVLGLATGNTPRKLYRRLVDMHRNQGLDFSAVTTFNLDEYLGLGPDHPGSYRYFMRENLFDHININPKLCYIPNGLTDDVLQECETFESRIEGSGGIDIQILGIGPNGHIGFNEPGSSLGSRTRFKALTEDTRLANAEMFGGQENVPRFVITVGVGTIQEARRIILLAFGEQKAEIVRQAVEGPITCEVTASALQWHRSTVFLLDEAAASKLKRRDYYKYAYEHKWKYLQK